MSDRTIAQIARRLAVALSNYAIERRVELSKEIAVLHTELCAAVRAEGEKDAT